MARVRYFHTYVSGIFTLGLHGGVGKQLSASEKKPFKAFNDENGLYQINNGQKEYIQKGVYNYVVSPKGGLYILTADENYSHNAIRASQPVQCAGTIYIENGCIKSINNKSEHYLPNREQLLRALGGLFAADLVNTGVRVGVLAGGIFSCSTKDIGTIEELIQQDEIKIPLPWIASAEFSHRMAKI